VFLATILGIISLDDGVTPTVNLGWVQLDDKSIDGDEGFETATDVFTISSLYGKRINKKWAASA